MDTTYIIIWALSALALVTLIAILCNMKPDNSWGFPTFLLAVGCCVTFIVMGLFSVTPNNVTYTETRPVKICRSFDSIALKATDWPEQLTTDINVLERPVVIKKTTLVNKWGGDAKDKYTIEFVKDPTAQK